MPRLPPPAKIAWDGPLPRAEAFDDIYFSRAGGLAEAEAVFLGGCGLPDGWRGRARYSVCELGFGAGLNALAAWRAWRRTRAPGAVLHFVSIESHPMRADEAARAHAAFPELADLSAQLVSRWPVRAYAPQRIWFDADGFALTVIHGRAEDALESLVGAFDAFFLDGFAPARNPDMWSGRIARRLAALAAPGARAASYSVAGGVRRALTEAGFAVEKKPGFAGKRERLEARLARSAGAANTLYPYRACGPARVAIVGGGIAGAAMARAVRRRGAQALLFERAPALAHGASGNAAGLVMPRLDRGRGPLQEAQLAAFVHAVDAYGPMLDACGAVERGRPDLIEDPPLPPDWLRADGQAGDVLHVRAGVLAPRDAIAAWTSGADIRLNAPIEEIGEALRAADAVVLAPGPFLDAFAQTRWLTLRRTKGQVETAALRGPAPPRALIGESYAAPRAGGLTFGATFERTAARTAAACAAARAANVAALARLDADLAARIYDLNSRASVRAAAPDYMPIAGLAPDPAAWMAAQAGLAHGREPDLSRPAPAHAGIYLFGALSARGLTLAPLLADRLAAEMFGEPQALSAAALDAMHPARFLHRMLKKGLTMPASVQDDGAGAK